MWSTMLAAGIPAFRALEILASNSEWKDSLETVLEKISSGHSLAYSFRQGGVEDPMILGVLGMAEKAGTLQVSILELAALFRWRSKFRAELMSKLTYPILLTISCALFVGLVPPLLLRPILEFLLQTGQPIAWSTALLWGFVQFSSSPLSIFLGAALLAGVLWEARRRFASSPSALEDVAQRIPVLRRCWWSIVSLRFGRALLSALGTGYPILGALQLSAACSGSRVLTCQAANASRKLLEGESLPQVLDCLEAVDPLLRTNLVLAMEAGTVEPLLGATLELMGGKLNFEIESLLLLLEPLLIGFMGLLVALCVLGTVSPMMAMLGALS